MTRYLCKMKHDFLALRAFILEEIKHLKEEWWAESYDKRLYDDESINKDSVYVPDDIKNSIKKWIKDMRLG